MIRICSFSSLLLLIFLCLLSYMAKPVVSQAQCDSSLPKCKTRANRDLIFLVDGSNSMDKDKFYGEMLDYAIQIFCAFSPDDQNQVGMILFNGVIKTIIPVQQRTAAQWIAAVEAIRADKNHCCSCCTPTADAIDLAKKEFTSHGRKDAVQIAFVISDGVPYNNNNGPYAYPKVSLADYMYGKVPTSASKLKGQDIRLLFVGVPDADGNPPNADYFAGIPDPALTPSGSPTFTQCVERNGKKSCGIIKAKSFPIVSEPSDANLFTSNTWDVNSLIEQTIDKICQVVFTQAPTSTDAPTNKPTTSKPTKKPTFAPTGSPSNKPTPKPTNKPSAEPTMKPTTQPTKLPTRDPTMKPTRRPTKRPTDEPTKRPSVHPTGMPTSKPTLKPTNRPTTQSPTNRPTLKPSKTPTINPTNMPTRKPTLKPTYTPTRNPTLRPTSSPSLSPTKADLNHLDLHLLLDASGSMLDWNGLCNRVVIKDPEIVLSNIPDSKCWLLFLSFSLKLAKEIALLGLEGPMKWQGQRNDPGLGLRVSVTAFACTPDQKTPVTYDLINQANTFADFLAQMNEAAKSVIPYGGTCPSEAIDHVISRIQNVDRNVRPFQAALLLTDGVFYDFPYPKISSDGFRYFKVPTYAVGIAISSKDDPNGLGDQLIDIQRSQLKAFVGDIPGRVYNLGSDGFSILQDIAYELAVSLPPQFNRNEVLEFEPWCGFTTEDSCLTSKGSDDVCRWFGTDRACRAVTFCNQFFGTKCTKNKYCTWTGVPKVCKTLGKSNGGSQPPVTNYPTTAKPTTSSATKYPTIPTVLPTQFPSQPSSSSSPTMKPSTAKPTTPTSPGTCSWSSEITGNGGEFTPFDLCSSKTAMYGCKYRNYCCWNADANTCIPPNSCPECPARGSQLSCNQVSNCCVWNTEVGACQRRCFGAVDDVCQ